MVALSTDSKVDFVLEQIDTMVASEGGSIELLSVDKSSLRIKYHPGVNEECPECVPDLKQVSMFLKASLGIHAPHIIDIDLN